MSSIKIELPTVAEFEALVIVRNEKLLKQYTIRRPPAELTSGMAERFFKMAEAEDDNWTDKKKLALLSEMYVFMLQFLDDPQSN